MDRYEEAIFRAIAELSNNSVDWAREKKYSKWSELEFDELDNLELVMIVEERLDVDLNDSRFETLLTIADVDENLTVLEVIDTLRKRMSK